MLRLTKHLLLPSLLLVLAAGLHLNAQAPRPKTTPIIATRLFSGPDGQTHAEPINLSASTSGPNAQADLLKSSGIRFATRGAGTSDDWHTAPGRQYLVTLKGQVDIEIGNGEKVHAGTGSILLIEDTTGKGHRATVVGTEEWHVLFIPIATATH